MTHSGEINEPNTTPRREPRRSRLLALLVAVLLAATATVAFTAGSASAQTQKDNGDANQQQTDDSTTDDSTIDDGASDDGASDDGDGSCDRDGTHRGGRLGRSGLHDTLTQVLGIDAATLREQLKGGSTLADIATEQGIEVSDVVDALVTAISNQAAERDREIDTDELSERITAFVNGERPERGEGGHDRRGGRGHAGKGSFGIGRWGGHSHSNADAPATTT